MRSRPNLVGAGFAVLLAGGSIFMRLTGSAATGVDPAITLRATEDALVIAQADSNSAKPTAKPPVKHKPPPPNPAASGTDAPPAAPKEGAGAPAPVGTPQAAPVPQASADGVGEFQPVVHAQGAKITTCMDTILNQSSSVIDSAHTAISTWVSSAPNDNAFQSIVGLSYPNKMAPNAASIIFAAPVGPGRCEGETVQSIHGATLQRRPGEPHQGRPHHRDASGAPRCRDEDRRSRHSSAERGRGLRHRRDRAEVKGNVVALRYGVRGALGDCFNPINM